MEGPLRDGSIQFRQDPCEYRFVLAETEGTVERAMNVRFPQCVVPDTFRDGMGISVVVEGHVQPDGSFLATQVIPRCPSRYEMDQRQQNGEAAPHSMPSSS
jgi:cytochrome c-type biogenesis protein CcmE